MLFRSNVEIAEEIGSDNMFIFGANVKEVSEYRKLMEEGKRDYAPPSLIKVITALFDGRFGNLTEMKPMIEGLTKGNDKYIICWDFPSYIEAQSKVDECYKNQKEWLIKSIKSISCSGKFSTDRTMLEYAENIW